MTSAPLRRSVGCALGALGTGPGRGFFLRLGGMASIRATLCNECIGVGVVQDDYTMYLYMIPVRGSLPPPPPPPHGMVPKPAFCSILHENVVFAMFFAWWVAGAVRKPASSWDFCNQTSENVFFAMFRLRHRGVVQSHPLYFYVKLSYNSKSSTKGLQPQ